MKFPIKNGNYKVERRLKKTTQSTVHVFTRNTDHIPGQPKVLLLLPVVRLERSEFPLFGSGSEDFGPILSCSSLSDSTSHLWRYGTAPNSQDEAWSSPQEPQWEFHAVFVLQEQLWSGRSDKSNVK